MDVQPLTTSHILFFDKAPQVQQQGFKSINIINSLLSLGHVHEPFKLKIIKPPIKKPS